MSAAIENVTAEITESDVKDPVTVAGFNGAAAVHAMREAIASALGAAGDNGAEIARVRRAFMRGWVARRLGAGRLTVTTVTKAEICLDTNAAKRTPEQSAAEQAARTAWSRYSAGDNQTRGKGAGRPEGAKADAKADAKLSDKVKEPVALVKAGDVRKYASPADTFNHVEETLLALAAGLDANPAAGTPNMRKAVDIMRRAWHAARPE